MSDWPVGLSTGCFYHTPILECIEDIIRGGFTMVEICSSPMHLDYHDKKSVEMTAKKLSALGVEPYSFHAPFHENIDITSPDPGMRKHARNEILTAAHAAAHLQVRHFVIHPGPEKDFAPPLGERLNRLNNAAEILEEVASFCGKAHIGIVLENMLPHLMFGNVQDMLWIMGKVRNINVGTCLDTGHASLSGDIDRVMYKLSGHLQLIHASDNEGTFDDHLPPGKGNIDWYTLFLTISDTGFDGGIIMELKSEPQQKPDEILAKARQGNLFLRNISRLLDVGKPPTALSPGQAPLK